MDKTQRKKRPMSSIVALHYVKFCFRLILFLSASGVYVYNRFLDSGKLFGGLEDNFLLLTFIWLFFFVEMVLRFFPSRFESAGCQKQFARNFEPTKVKTVPKKKGTAMRTFWAAAAWIFPNTIFTVLYLMGVFDTGIMVLLALCYSVCDIICILFFCPFQTWILKNKCCVSCRIYNWDYAMMFTPFIFVKNVYTWSLLGMALLLLIHWELAVRLHPERFSEETNDGLACRKCREKLCHHKKQLRFVWKNRKFNVLDNGSLEK